MLKACPKWPILLRRLHLLVGPQPSQTAAPPRDQVFKLASLRGTFHIQTVIQGYVGSDWLGKFVFHKTMSLKLLDTTISMPFYTTPLSEMLPTNSPFACVISFSQWRDRQAMPHSVPNQNFTFADWPLFSFRIAVHDGKSRVWLRVPSLGPKCQTI